MLVQQWQFWLVFLACTKYDLSVMMLYNHTYVKTNMFCICGWPACLSACLSALSVQLDAFGSECTENDTHSTCQRSAPSPCPVRLSQLSSAVKAAVGLTWCCMVMLADELEGRRQGIAGQLQQAALHAPAPHVQGTFILSSDVLVLSQTLSAALGLHLLYVSSTRQVIT